MSSFSRRDLIAASSAAALFPSALRAQTRGSAFSWAGLVAQAEKLSRSPYRNVPSRPGAEKVNYDALHKAVFRDERMLWGDLPGDTGVRFFPVHQFASQPVTISVVEGGRASPVRYDPAMFDMPADHPLARMGPDAGFSGFRLMNAARDGDWLVFMGASYFRAAGAQKQYGLSARAIAINTSKQPEEFPRFTSFWLERTGDNALTVYALLDGPSIAGAYRFRNRFDKAGVHQDVDAALFPRREIPELGLMPMTSMFWFDEAHRSIATDWRPEVHDSDGMAMRSGDGTAHFRPLANPKAPRVSVFAERNPAGFGLIQRDRNFDHYQDDGVFYERRPSLWATPARPLGEGTVRLYEFPTNSEYDDNVAAYWVPDAAVRPGKRIDASYRLDWTSADVEAPSRVVAVRKGKIEVPPSQPESKAVRLVADFAGLDAKDGIVAWTDVKGGTLDKKALYPIVGQAGMWRLVLDIMPAGAGQIDILAQLRGPGDRPASELLHYPFYP
ncbi:glucan biosynthesis protein [Sphingobium aquiterrae]|uniref:glucan biosynthesis protein n=1 Tax=Sphingobium aquiterrae TaxID=2038656 RepID=UPI0030189062